MNRKYGKGNWEGGAGSEASKIQKYGNHHFKTVVPLSPSRYRDLRMKAEEYNKALKEWEKEQAEIMTREMEKKLKENKTT